MKKTLGIMMSALLTAAAFGKYDAKIDLDKTDGIYRVGETAVCTVQLFEDGKPLKGAKARLVRKWEGWKKQYTEFTTTGEPMKFTYKGVRPGWVYFGVELLGEDGNPLKASASSFKALRDRKPTIVTEIGAMFSPEKIVSPVREPADFDEFWAKRKAEVDAVTAAPTLTQLRSPAKGVKLFAVTIPCPRGVTATGYLAYPEDAKPGTLPAFIFFQSLTYGDVSRHSAVSKAKQGAVAFAATWHGFPVSKPVNYYPKVLKPYFQGGQPGLGDREKWVYGDMFFRVMSELKFLKSRPEWDGKTLVVYGGSLGGIQSAFAAAIEPAATMAVVSVPSSCECNAHEAGRVPYGTYKRVGVKKLKEHPELLEAGFYYDAVNFGKRIKCEVHVCTGFTDESCYPSNVYAFYNAIPETTKKSITTNPRTGHFNTTKNVSGDSRVGAIFNSTEISELPKNR